MGAMADVEPQPLAECEVTEHGMPHEEVGPGGRQQLPREREEARHAVAQLALHHARIGMRGRLGYLRGATPRRNPPDIEIQEMRQPSPRRPRGPSPPPPPPTPHKKKKKKPPPPFPPAAAVGAASRAWRAAPGTRD